MWRQIRLVVLLSLGVVAGCEHDLGGPPPGATLRGTVTYAGTVAEGFGSPSLIIGVATELTQPPSPHSIQVIENVDLSQPVAYELRFVPEATYFLFATLIDGDDPETVGPLGLYPNVCDAAVANVAITTQGVHEGLDLTVYDITSQDPCFSEGVDISPEECPPDTAGTVRLDITTARTTLDALGSDLIAGLATEWPPSGELSPSFVAPPGSYELPALGGLNGVAPGAYYVYVCLDEGRDATAIPCAGAGDLAAVTSAPVTVEAGMITDVSVDLDAGSATTGTLVAPGPECIPAVVSITFTNTSGSLTVDSGDTIGFALWDSSPIPPRPQDFGSREEVTAFPQTVTVEVPEDQYWSVACFQKFDSTAMACDGPGDVRVFVNGLSPFETMSGQTTSLTVDIP